MNTCFSVSIVIPTLNSAGTLGMCLDSITLQDYPKEKLEVIFADAGSRDKTVELIESFRKNHPDIKTLLVDNPLKTGEAGKARALKEARGEIVAFIDSDNILDGASWFSRMVEPFDDGEIIASEPIRYTYRRTDGYITRYCALMGMNDPLCYFLGNYDRECILSGRWTEMPHEVVENNGRFMKLRLDPKRMPTIGANGFFIRRQALDDIGIRDYLFDIDILSRFFLRHPEHYFSKVSLGIIHVFAGNLKGLWMKQLRRIVDFKRFKTQRAYDWGKMNKAGLFYFCFSCVTIAPLIFQTLRGAIQKNDSCWLIHPVFCAMTFSAYLWGFFKSPKIKRDTWQFRP